jgi:hypothetical protein
LAPVGGEQAVAEVHLVHLGKVLEAGEADDRAARLEDTGPAAVAVEAVIGDGTGAQDFEGVFEAVEAGKPGSPV